MEIVLPHAITYTTKGDVPVSIVAKSLIANERLIQEAMRLLEGLAPGCQVSKVTVRVDELTNGSPLKEIFAVALFVTFQKELGEEVPELIEKLTGVHIPDSMDTLVTVLVLMVAMYVLDQSVTRLLPDRKNKKLRKEYERKTEELAKLSGRSAKDIQQLVDERIDDPVQRSVLPKVRELIQPAQLDENAEITVPGGNGISNATIREIPTDIDFELIRDPRSYERVGVEIEVHRADRDENKHGWRAIIPEVSDKKIRMELAPDIEPASLYGRTKIIGDVSVEEQVGAAGVPEITAYHLLAARGQVATKKKRPRKPK